MSNVWAVVMAGGVGSRFWPVSRAARPKQLLDLFGDGPMLRVTVDRVAERVPLSQVVVVTSETLVEPIGEILPGLPPENLLAEPVGRNTAPAIAWGALHIGQQDPDALLMVLPSDHHIADPEGFLRHVDLALAAAATGRIVTLGIQPTRPETGYGYIAQGAPLADADGAYAVDAFKEKPDVATALGYLKAGRYVWNAGMFFMPVRLILEELRRTQPAMMAALETVSPEAIPAAYPALESISIDYAVMEKSPHVAVVPGEFGWSDVGSWESLYDHRGDGETSLKSGHVIEIDGGGNVLFADGDATVATVGVKDLIVVHTEDATFVCPRESAQRAREIVAALKLDAMTKGLL